MAERFGLDRLTPAEIADVEAYTGLSRLEIGELLSGIEGGRVPATFPVRLATAMFWIIGRRADPKFALVDARRLAIRDLGVWQRDLLSNAKRRRAGIGLMPWKRRAGRGGDRT